MFINSQAACEKSFFYGSLVYLLWKGGCGPLKGTLIAAVGIALIELAQTRFINHTPEITDPILVILAALTLSALKTSDAPSQHEDRISKAHASSPKKNPDLTSDSAPAGPYKQLIINKHIDLRPDQVDFLRDLSKTMGISTSRAIRRIIDDVMQDMQQHQEPKDNGTLDFMTASPSVLTQTGDELISYNFRLQKKQIEFLAALKESMETDFSSVVRIVMDRFITTIE
jgi:hypothetical protein